MEQIKKILVHQFWILLGIALIVPIVGWYIGTGSLLAEATIRTKDLDTKFQALDGIISANNPNDKWKLALSGVNAQQDAKIKDAWRLLWQRQVENMTWRPELFPEQAGINPKDPLKATTKDLLDYRNTYEEERLKVFQLINPVEKTEDDEGNIKSTGIVVCSPRLVPDESLPWKDLGATAEQIAESQEDLWLYASLLESIERVNRASGAMLTKDAPVRQIITLELRGGDRTKATSGNSTSVGGAARPAGGAPTTGSTTTGYAAKAGGAMASMLSQYGSNGPPGLSLGGGGLGRGPSPFSGSGAGAKLSIVAFNPDNEWGPMTAVAAPLAVGSTPTPGAVNKPAVSKLKRDIDDNPMWRTRGFYLEAVITSQSLPDLIASLSNSRWPTRVVRVHQADIDNEDLVPKDPSAVQGPSSSPTSMMSNMTAGASGGSPTGAGAISRTERLEKAGSMLTPPPGVANRPGNPDDDDDRLTGGVPAGPNSAMPSVETDSISMNDPTLTVVAISGEISIYKDPDNGKPPAVVIPSPAPAAPVLATAPPVAPATDKSAPVAPAATTAPANAIPGIPAAAPATAGKAAPAGDPAADGDKSGDGGDEPASEVPADDGPPATGTDNESGTDTPADGAAEPTDSGSETEPDAPAETPAATPAVTPPVSAPPPGKSE